MIKKFQRHPTDDACVILHVVGVLAASIAKGSGTIVVTDPAYRDALETASADPNHAFFGKLVGKTIEVDDQASRDALETANEDKTQKIVD